MKIPVIPKNTKSSSVMMAKRIAELNGCTALVKIVLPTPPRKRKKGIRKAGSNRQPEREISKTIIGFLKMYGVTVGKLKNTGAICQGRWIKDSNLFLGVPDLIAFYKNKMWFIECKSPTGKQSEEQLNFERLCKDCNINYILARGVNDVEVIL